MTLDEIKAAVDAGQTVHWASDQYVVVKGRWEYLIKCLHNNHCIGLTHQDGITMNGKPEEFFLPTYSRDITLTLTEVQLEDVIVCVNHALARGLGYGHITEEEEAILSATREHTLKVLKGYLNSPSGQSR